MSNPHTTDDVKRLIMLGDCTLLSSYVNNRTSLKYQCNHCGQIGYGRYETIRHHVDNHELLCADCRRQQRVVASIEQRIRDRLYEDKVVQKLTKHYIWLICDRCNQVKSFRRSFFLSHDYLMKHDDVCCEDCTRMLRRKTPEEYRKEFEIADINHEYKLLTDYVTSKSKVKVKHLVCGHVYMVAAGEFTGHGRRCPYCAGHLFTRSEYNDRRRQWVSDYESSQPEQNVIVFNPKPSVEQWKRVASILQCNNYKVSNCGRVRNINTQHILSQRYNPQTKYMIITLQKDNHVSRTIAVHRLVALTWIPGNEKNDRMIFVNHIDEDRRDNWVTNLEWCSLQYNTNYGSGTYRLSCSLRNRVYQTVEQWNVDHTKLLQTYSSIQQAVRTTGIGVNVIKRIATTHELNGSPYDFEIIDTNKSSNQGVHN